jgi:acyl carrier protein
MTISRDDIVKRVDRAILADFDIDEAAMLPDAKLGDDLGLDSLDGIDLVVAIEKAFKEHRVTIAEGDVRKLQTLKDIYDYIEARVSKEA